MPKVTFIFLCRIQNAMTGLSSTGKPAEDPQSNVPVNMGKSTRISPAASVFVLECFQI
jgi:hypothetical protein